MHTMPREEPPRPTGRAIRAATWEADMPDRSTALTAEEMEPDIPEELGADDFDARSSEDFPKIALDTDLVNASHAVVEVFDDDDLAGSGEPIRLDEREEVTP
jgi:hypothetical protein